MLGWEWCNSHRIKTFGIGTDWEEHKSKIHGKKEENARKWK